MYRFVVFIYGAVESTTLFYLNIKISHNPKINLLIFFYHY